MKTLGVCEVCKVKITTKTDKCPLCHSEIKVDNKAIKTYPSYKPLKERYVKYIKIISTISPVLIVLSIILNLFVWKDGYWSIIASSCVIYFWLLGSITFNRKIHLGLKLIAHAITIPLVLIFINMFATSDKIIDNVTWAISYTLPSIILSFIFVITFIMIRRKQRFKDYILYLISLCLIGFIPLIVVLSDVAKPLYPSIITAIYSYFTIIYLILFSKNQIKEELKKRLHL